MVETQPGAFEVARTYTVLGIEHILLGYRPPAVRAGAADAGQGAAPLIATITAFTLAHSLTLAAATLGWLHVPGPPVEASIALSIAFVAARDRARAAGPAGA